MCLFVCMKEREHEIWDEWTGLHTTFPKQNIRGVRLYVRTIIIIYHIIPILDGGEGVSYLRRFKNGPFYSQS